MVNCGINCITSFSGDRMFLLAVNKTSSLLKICMEKKHILITAYSELFIFYLKCSFLNPLLPMMVKEINKNYLIFPSHVFLNEEYMTTLCTKDHSY